MPRFRQTDSSIRWISEGRNPAISESQGHFRQSYVNMLVGTDPRASLDPTICLRDKPCRPRHKQLTAGGHSRSPKHLINGDHHRRRRHARGLAITKGFGSAWGERAVYIGRRDHPGVTSTRGQGHRCARLGAAPAPIVRWIAAERVSIGSENHINGKKNVKNAAPSGFDDCGFGGQ